MKFPLKKLSFFLLLSLFTLLCTHIYRPWVYINGIEDFHIADSHPNLMCVPVAYSFFDFLLSLCKRKIKRPFEAIISLCVGFLIYECLQIKVGGFDVFDCIATVIGALMTYSVVIITDNNVN